LFLPLTSIMVYGYGGYPMGGYGGGMPMGSVPMMGGYGGGGDAWGGWYGQQEKPKKPFQIREPSKCTDIMSFITENGLDERAQEVLAGCTEEVHKLVMERGDVKDCRNPSSVILGRIKEIHSSGAVASPQGAATPEEVEQFILDGALDERASDALRQCTPEVARAVLDRGGLQSTRNPSSAVLGRIRDASAAAGPSVAAFIADNGLDERGAEALMALSPDQQQAVMARGSVKECRNPSSALIGRIRDLGKGGGGGLG